jgi:hypothetical protein
MHVYITPLKVIDTQNNFFRFTSLRAFFSSISLRWFFCVKKRGINSAPPPISLLLFLVFIADTATALLAGLAFDRYFVCVLAPLCVVEKIDL